MQPRQETTRRNRIGDLRLTGKVRGQEILAGQLYGQPSISISMDSIARVSVYGDAMRWRAG